MITVDIPASFEWNNINYHWVKNYLIRKSDLLSQLINNSDLDINTMTEDHFKALCQLLETTAEGRELRNKMFKAWRSKKSRDSDNGKKLYTFNLSISAGTKLKQIAKETPLNKTLESLIFAGKTDIKRIEKLQKEIKQLNIDNTNLRSQLSEALVEKQADHVSSFNNNNTQVNELAKLEKSQLIKQILMLKRKLQQT